MVFTKHNGGETVASGETNADNAFAYSAAIGYALDGAAFTNQTNFKADLFGSDTVTRLSFMEYNSGTDLYECMDLTTTYYIIIEATSTTDTTSGDATVVQADTGKWIVFATAGTYEVNRAKVFKHLFEGGSTAKIVANYTSITTLKTIDANDVDKQAYWAELSGSKTGSDSIVTRTDVFDDTSDNDDCSPWSKLIASGAVSADATYQFASGNTVNSVINGTSNELGTDRSADELNNPANHKFITSHNGAQTTGYTQQTIVLCFGAMTKGTRVLTNTASEPTTDVLYDFEDTASIPLLTLDSSGGLICSMVTDTETITTNETAVIVKSVNTLTVGNSMVTEVSFNGGTNYTTATEEQLIAIANTGTAAQVRFTITRANNDEQDSITSYGYYYS